MDDKKTIEENIDNVLTNAGGPGSILAAAHNALLKSVLQQAGKFTGSFFTSENATTGGVVEDGFLYWNDNALNETNDFIITVSKNTADSNDIGLQLDFLKEGDLIRFKDFSGRSAMFIYKSHVAGVDANTDDIYDITISGLAENPAYTYISTDSEVSSLEFISKPENRPQYQPEITAENTVLTANEEGLNKIYPFNGSVNQTITVPSGVYVENDTVIIERRGNEVEFLAGSGVSIRGVRDINNRFFIEDTYSSVSLICQGNDVFILEGNNRRGYTGAVQTASYTPLEDGDVNVDITVTGSGFSANMKDPVLTGNATLNSWTFISNTQITLNVTETGTAGDFITVTYDNGDIFVDTDAMQIVSASLGYDPNDLRHYYRLSANSNDEVASLNGTDTGMVYVSGSADFDGTTSFIDLPDSNTLSYGNGTTDNDMSVSFMINFDTVADCEIINKWLASSDREYRVIIQTGDIKFIVRDESSSGVLNRGFTHSFIAGTWYHVVVTKTGSTMKMYIDGTEVTLQDLVVSSYTAMENGSSDVRIGSQLFASGGFLDGKIKRLGFWNTLLSQSEVTAIRNQEAVNDNNLL